jgi:hypothetical protein
MALLLPQRPPHRESSLIERPGHHMRMAEDALDYVTRHAVRQHDRRRRVAQVVESHARQRRPAYD